MPSETNRRRVTTTVEHPTWCDLNRCTATPAVARGETHQGTPFTVTVRSVHETLKVTACLARSHCRWPTDVYVDFASSATARATSSGNGRRARHGAGAPAVMAVMNSWSSPRWTGGQRH
jgi:hypothetical protein